MLQVVCVGGLSVAMVPCAAECRGQTVKERVEEGADSDAVGRAQVS